MFQTPSRTATAVPPPPGLDVDERYLFKVTALNDEGISKFADPAKKEDFHNISWHFNVAHADTRQPIFDAEGKVWEFVDFTTSKTGKNPKNGMVAKARLWIEAFLGHSVEDDEITADLPAQLVGRYASGFFENKELESQDGSTYTKLQIMRLSPFKGAAEAKPEPAPAAAVAPAAQPDIPF